MHSPELNWLSSQYVETQLLSFSIGLSLSHSNNEE